MYGSHVILASDPNSLLTNKEKKNVGRGHDVETIDSSGGGVQKESDPLPFEKDIRNKETDFDGYGVDCPFDPILFLR